MQKSLVQKSLITLVSSVVFLLPKTALAETLRFTIVSTYGCNSSGCDIVVKTSSGNRYDVTYSTPLGVQTGDAVLIEINGDTWQYITNPTNNKTANITRVYRW